MALLLLARGVETATKPSFLPNTIHLITVSLEAYKVCLRVWFTNDIVVLKSMPTFKICTSTSINMFRHAG